jgi:curved DNA-binding protein CbpA
VKDYYRILGLQRSAKAEDVKAAYLRLAQKFHPDKNLDCAEWASNLFKEVQEAYGVLGDAAKRRHYDLYQGLRLDSRHVQPIRQPAKDPMAAAIDFLVRAASPYVPPDQMTELLQRALLDHGVPARPVTLVDLAERVGILKRKRRRA